MANLSRFRQGAHSRYESSEEVLAAIEEVAGVALPLNNAGEENEASRIWGDPTEAEMRAVEAKAWELADADEDALHWGAHTLRRG